MCFAFSTGDRTIQNSYDDSHWGRFLDLACVKSLKPTPMGYFYALPIGYTPMAQRFL